MLVQQFYSKITHIQNCDFYGFLHPGDSSKTVKQFVTEYTENWLHMTKKISNLSVEIANELNDQLPASALTEACTA